MKISIVLAFLLVSGLAVASTRGPGPQEPLRLGVFDSRALAVAYARSDAHAARLAELRARKARAESAGNAKEVAAIEAEGGRWQKRMHLQAFSIAPIDDVLAAIEPDLPGIAERTGVDALVNRWSIAYQTAGVELVDVTEAMVAPFHPDEKTLSILRSMKDMKPLPLEEAEEAD